MARGKSNRRGLNLKGAQQELSEKFLVINGRKDNVITTDSGLQYIVLDESTQGVVPSHDSSVTVHQRVSLIDKTSLDDTYIKETPETFTMKESIAGYYEGLMLMHEGARYRFFIPPALAWENRGTGNSIGPYEVIIIDCRLISVSENY